MEQLGTRTNQQLPSLIPPLPSTTEGDIASWLKAAELDRLLDKNQQSWNLKVVLSEIFDRTRNEAGYAAELVLSANVEQNDLIVTGVLDPQNDERLLRMIGESKIAFVMRWKKGEYITSAKFRAQLLDRISKIKTYLATTDLSPKKRQIIGEFIDRKCQFSKFHSNP